MHPSAPSSRRRAALVPHPPQLLLRGHHQPPESALYRDVHRNCGPNAEIRPRRADAVKAATAVAKTAGHAVRRSTPCNEELGSAHVKLRTSERLPSWSLVSSRRRLRRRGRGQVGRLLAAHSVRLRLLRAAFGRARAGRPSGRRSTAGRSQPRPAAASAHRSARSSADVVVV